ncbi:MAG: flagellar biosynthesis protein FlhF [Eubacterium sp.]|nr:flagellar biosynthesis protein FlhF [Eubacterium sp.]
MTINKFQGKTESEAIERARKEMGPQVVIMSVKTVKPKGVFRAFKGIVYEVTAALEENEADKMRQSAPEQVPQQPQMRRPESINLAADEQIRIPSVAQGQPEQPARMPQQPLPQNEPAPEQPQVQMQPQQAAASALEERLDSLQSLLENRISAEKENQEDGMGGANGQAQEGFSFVKMLYQTLLDNEVDEKYANQILDELEKISNKGSNIDYILSHIYQKLVLKFGQPKPIEFQASKPTVAFFIGPTGVGKTTTIAKVASRYKVDEGKKVAFLTADTYRIAATEQLRTYASILDMPLTIVYSPEEIKDAVGKLSDYDLILVDTAGFSHKNAAQCEDVKNLIGGLSAGHKTEVYLVLSATTKYRDLQDMCNIYRTFADYRLIFTKLDETSCYGNLLNIHLYSGADLSYATYGQNVPDDIEVFNTQKIVKKLLGGD